MMLKTTIVALGLCFALPAAAQSGGGLTCLSDSGKVYTTNKSSCPEKASDFRRKKILSCILPNGSRGFGDKCPSGAEVRRELAPEDLSQRTGGLSDIDPEGSNRMLREAEQREQTARYHRQAEAMAEEERKLNEDYENAVREERERRRY